MTEEHFEPTRWWRAISPEGELWAESSNEEEIRERARPTDKIQQLHQTVPKKLWLDDPKKEI